MRKGVKEPEQRTITKKNTITTMSQPPVSKGKSSKKASKKASKQAIKR
jgi:hypothetical protein